MEGSKKKKNRPAAHLPTQPVQHSNAETPLKWWYYSSIRVEKMCMAHPEKQLKFTCGTYNEMNMVACGRIEHLFLPWPFHILGIYPVYPRTCIMN